MFKSRFKSLIGEDANIVLSDHSGESMAAISEARSNGKVSIINVNNKPFVVSDTNIFGASKGSLFDAFDNYIKENPHSIKKIESQ